MNLFRVDFQHNMRPPMLVRGISRAQISRQMKERYGDLFLRVDYISYEDAESQFGHFDLFKNVSVGENNKYKYNNNEDSTMQKDIKTVNEVSKKTLTNYMKGAERDKARKWGQRDMGKVSSDDALHNQVKRNIGIDMAKAKIRPAKVKASEEVDQVDEISRDMKSRYIKKASNDVYQRGMSQGVDLNTPNRTYPDKKQYPATVARMDKNKDKSNKRLAGIAKASEEVETNEGKAYGPTGVSYHVPTGHKDEVDPKTKEKYPERQKNSYKGPEAKPYRNEAFVNAAQQTVVMAKLKKSGDYKKPKNEEFAEFITPNSDLTEEIYFKVNIQGLPDMYMTASSAGMIKAKLRKMLKNMDMIGDIVKTPKADVRKAFRMKAMEGEDSQDESTILEEPKENPQSADKVKPVDKKASPNVKLMMTASKEKSRAEVIKIMNKKKGQMDEDLISNKARFSSPSSEVFEHENSLDFDSTSINFTSILTGSNPFYKPIIEKQRLDPKCWDGYEKAGTKMKGDTRVNNCVKEEPYTTMEGQDEIQDKNADGLDDNQKPEGNKTAKQFPAPKDAKKKMKSLKMEMKSDIADLVIEKAKLKKNDIKMRAGKLDPKAMSALKTMNQDEAKVLVQGLPSNLRRSTMKELGIREVVVPNIVENLISKKR